MTQQKLTCHKTNQFGLGNFMITLDLNLESFTLSTLPNPYWVFIT